MRWFKPNPKNFDHSAAIRATFTGTYGDLSVSGHNLAPGHSLSVKTEKGMHFVSCSCGYGPEPL